MIVDLVKVYAGADENHRELGLDSCGSGMRMGEKRREAGGEEYDEVVNLSTAELLETRL